MRASRASARLVEHDRHTRAEHDAGGCRAAEVLELLRQHVARLEVGDDQDVGGARDLRDDALGARRGRGHRVVERERPVEDRAGDLAAVGHLASAAASSVAGMFGLIVSTAARIATRGFASPNACARSTALRMMSALSCSVGEMLIAASVMMKGRG